MGCPATTGKHQNRGGGSFRCLEVVGLSFENKAIMQNIESLWTLQANGCGMYGDGTIDWDYSTGGHFAQEESVWQN